MGHKVHPYGFRLGYTRTWTAKWYADKEYTSLLREDISIRKLLDRRRIVAPVLRWRLHRSDAHAADAVDDTGRRLVIEPGQQLSHRNGFTLRHKNLGEESGGGRGNVERHLLGFHFQEWLIFFDWTALGNQPFDDGPFGDAFT